MTDENNRQSTEKEEAYEDRNLLALAYLKKKHDIYEQLPGKTIPHPDTYGWKELDDEDSNWVIVWAREGKGQMAWHMPRELVKDLEWLPKKDIEFDGHTRKEKNQRLRDFIEGEIDGSTIS